MIFELSQDPVFTSSVLLTLLRFFSGLSLSLILCMVIIPISLKFKLFGKMIEYFIFIFQPIPKIVLFPVFLLILGISDLTRVFLVATGLFFTNFIILQSATNELMSNPARRIIQFYKIRSSTKFSYYYLKGLRGPLSSALKNSTGYGLTLTVIAESYFSNNGIGFLIWRYWERYEVPELSVTIIFISMIAVFLNIIWSYLLEKS